MHDIPLRPGCSRLTSWRTTPLLWARATLRISWITDHPLSRRFPLRPSIPPSPVEEFIHEAPFAAPASQRQKVHSFTTTSRVSYDSTTSVIESWQSDGGQFLLCSKIPSGCWFSDRISVPLRIRSLGRSYLGNVSPLPDSFGISCSLDRKIIYSHYLFKRVATLPTFCLRHHREVRDLPIRRNRNVWPSPWFRHRTKPSASKIQSPCPWSCASWTSKRCAISSTNESS